MVGTGRRIRWPSLALLVLLAALRAAPALALDQEPPRELDAARRAGRKPAVVLERDVPVPMRDGTILRADIWRLSGPGRRPALICRTPYGKDTDPDELRFAKRAAAQGYAVIIQDVRGRYASAGVFEPHVNEGRDGFDTIEWAAAQPWCDGRVGTFGLSYPGCVQWLAALEQPPHLAAMAPAMSYARLVDCVYYGGVFDGDWLRWAYISMAPDERVRRGLRGARTGAEAWEEWQKRPEAELEGFLPMAAQPDLLEPTPYYARWLTTPPHSPWWGFADMTGRYGRVSAAVLNLDGWYDDAYGPKGAIANHQGLAQARAGQARAGQDGAEQAHPGSMLVLGPWHHGIRAVNGEVRHGTRDLGPEAYIDYDSLVLDFMDLHLKGKRNRLAKARPVRYFVMGSNQWREADSWPPRPTGELALHLDGPPAGGVMGSLRRSAPGRAAKTSFFNNPADPLRELPEWAVGVHDQRGLLRHSDRLAAFQSAPLRQDTTVAGNIRVELFVSVDAPDADIYVKVQDVAADGTAYPLMDQGAEVLRLSQREVYAGQAGEPAPLEPGRIYRISIDTLLTANTFHKGDRIRVIVCSSWFPGMSRNLQTGAHESASSAMRPARITVHHGPEHPSRVVLPLVAEDGTR